jgi:hypothetical protein
MFEKNQHDIRFTYERLQFTETTCDGCGEVILESEKRFEQPNNQLCSGVICEECKPEPITVPMLVKASDDGTLSYVGGFNVDFRGKFRFIPGVQSRKPGKVGRDTAAEAIPSWALPGYLVNVPVYLPDAGHQQNRVKRAIEIVDGYRRGIQWTVDLALAGDIEIVS